ncbi:hypothetical protein E2C01_022974 [Portunus trituberculatus]|uniref:Uncharacterized protein n=1 Tax=Portunus trituberculatus TaxID=210409 RepID=A0A5B7E923_PORTR|nr:hypothetical protein [Portunus trituberculatus]
MYSLPSAHTVGYPDQCVARLTSMLPGKTCILAQTEQPKANTTCPTLPSRDSSCSSPFKWESSPEPSTLQRNTALYTRNSMMWCDWALAALALAVMSNNRI